MAILTEARTWVAQCPEGANDTMVRGTPFEVGLASWSGNTQVEVALFSSASVASYIGGWLELLDGNAPFEWIRVRSFDGSNTVTVDPVSQSSPTATRARFWVPPESLLVATSNGATTTIEAAGRTETSIYAFADPDRYYAVCEESGGGSIARGEAKLISAFDGSSTFTTAAFTAASATGDLFVMRQPLNVYMAEMEEPSTEHAVIERKFSRPTMDRDPHVLGLRSGSFKLGLECKGAASASSTTGPTYVGAPKELVDLLADVMYRGDGASVDQYAGTVDNSGGASSTTAIKVTNNHHSRFHAGGMVMINGEVAVVTSVTDSGDANPDTVTVTPALTQAPITGDVVYGFASFRPRTNWGTTYHPFTNSTLRSTTIEIYRDRAIRTLLYGWHPNWKLEQVKADAIPRFIFEGPFDHHITSDIPSGIYTPTFDTQLARAARTSRVVIDGTSYTTVLESGFDYGITYSPATSVSGTAQGKNGHIMTGLSPKGTLKVWVENNNLREKFETEDEFDLLLQIGSANTETVGIWAPYCQFTKVAYGKESGGYIVECEYAVNNSRNSGVADRMVLGFG